MSKIALLSDLHEFCPDINDVDIAVFCGDYALCEKGDIVTEQKLWDEKYSVYFKYLRGSDIKVIGTAGNHDFLAEKYTTLWQYESHFDLFERDGIREFENFNWCMYGYNKLEDWALFLTDEEHKRKCEWLSVRSRIRDIDFLITHTGPVDYLGLYDWGSQHIQDLAFDIKPKHFHAFGHIHEGYGMKVVDGVTFVNCSYVDKDYKPRNQYITYDTETRKFDIVKCENLEF